MRRISLLGTLSISILIAAQTPALAQKQTVSMSGSIDNRFAIDMNLTITGNKVSGTYKYSTSKSPLSLDGTIDGGTLIRATEKDKGKVTGSFSGRLVGDKRLVGAWCNPKKTKFMPLIVASATVPNALDNGKDGIIITHQTKKIAKPKGSMPSDSAIVTFPIVSEKFLAGSVGPKVQHVISTKNVLDESPDEMAAAIKGGDLWLNEVDYTVNYNKNYLLDADFSRDGCGAYPDGSTYHVLVDLKSGNQIKAANAFNKASLPKLKELLKAKMTQEIKDSFKEFGDSPEELGALKEQFPQTVNVPQELLDNFTVSDNGLTFNHDWGFPHVCEALQPEGKYTFTYNELKAIIDHNGPLGQFVTK
jgi:hypothetical protein